MDTDGSDNWTDEQWDAYDALHNRLADYSWHAARTGYQPVHTALFAIGLGEARTQTELAAYANVSPRTVRRWCADLESLRFITWEYAQTSQPGKPQKLYSLATTDVPPRPALKIDPETEP